MSFNALQNQPATTIISGDGFYPDLKVAEFQANYRMPAEYAEGMIAEHIAEARLWAVKQLVARRAEWEGEGYTTLAAIPLFGIAGEAERTFKRAVFCHAKNLLLPQFATTERREAARHDARESPEITANFEAMAQEAIANLLGKSRITVAVL